MPEVIAHTTDGATLHFPDGTDPSIIQKAIKSHISAVMAPPPPPDPRAPSANVIKPVSGGLNQATPSNYMVGNPSTAAEGANNSIEFLRNILPPAAGAVAGAVATPYTGGLGTAAASGAAYTGVDALLKQLKIGNKESIPDSLKDSLVQAAINEAGGKIIGGVWKAAKAFRAVDQPEILKFLPTASQALQAEGKHPTVASILKYVEDHFAPGTKAAAQEVSAQEGSQLGYKEAAKIAGRSQQFKTLEDPNKVAEFISKELPLENVREGLATKAVPYATDPASLDKLIANPTRLQDALTRSQGSGAGINARQDIAAYRLARMQQEATTLGPNGVVKVDPLKVAASLNDPEMAASNKILFSGKQMSNIQQFYKNFAETQDKLQGFGGFGKLRLAMEGIGLTGSLAHALITGNAAPVAVALAPIGVEIGLAGLAKTLSNPKTARLMLALANNEALGVSDQFAAKVIMQAIQGATGNLINKDGSKTPFQVKGGQMVPLEGQ